MTSIGAARVCVWRLEVFQRGKLKLPEGARRELKKSPVLKE